MYSHLGVAVVVANLATVLFSDSVSGQLCRFFEQQKLTASDGGWADKLGLAASAFENRLVVGAPGHDWSTANDGAAYVFRLEDNATPNDPSDDVWVDVGELNAWDGGGAQMGSSVAAYGDRIIAGSIGSNDACGGEPLCYSGAAYVFRYVDPWWTPEQKLLASDMAPERYFGKSVSIHANWIAVGMVPDIFTNPVTGAAYLFRLDDAGTPNDASDDSWIEHAKLTTPGDSTSDWFGESIAVTNEYVVVGAPSAANGYQEPGWAYVFARDDNGTPSDTSDDMWPFDAALSASDAHGGQLFGFTLAAEDERVVVGAYEDSEFGNRAGAAYVFARHNHGTPADPSDDYWFEQAKLTASDAASYDSFGISVAIRGDRVAVGSWEDYTLVSGVWDKRGSAYVFRYVGGQWIQEQKLLASDGVFSHGFGRSVALSDNYVFTGAIDDADVAFDAGAEYVHAIVDDCNTNCVPDEEDIATGSSSDCNGNGLPDECEDCNNNGLADACDIDAGAPDCDGNGLPDECDPDCNSTGIPDACDIAGGTSEDCNNNGVPDECDRDCNSDGIPDDCAGLCTEHCECNDFRACTLDYCVEGACTHTATAYGDVTGNGVINLFDIFGMLDQMAGANADSTMHLYDIQPCNGDDVVNLLDVFAALDAIAGSDPCCW